MEWGGVKEMMIRESAERQKSRLGAQAEAALARKDSMTFKNAELSCAPLRATLEKIIIAFRSQTEAHRNVRSLVPTHRFEKMKNGTPLTWISSFACEAARGRSVHEGFAAKHWNFFGNNCGTEPIRQKEERSQKITEQSAIT